MTSVALRAKAYKGYLPGELCGKYEVPWPALVRVCNHGGLRESVDTRFSSSKAL